MTSLSEARKRDFINQLLLAMENQTVVLTDAGFDPTTKIAGLKLKSDDADNAEVKQQESMATSKDATQLAQNSLNAAYAEASATVELMTGLLGKNHNLIKEIRKMRK